MSIITTIECENSPKRGNPDGKWKIKVEMCGPEKIVLSGSEIGEKSEMTNPMQVQHFMITFNLEEFHEFVKRVLYQLDVENPKVRVTRTEGMEAGFQFPALPDLGKTLKQQSSTLDGIKKAMTVVTKAVELIDKFPHKKTDDESEPEESDE